MAHLSRLRPYTQVGAFTLKAPPLVIALADDFLSVATASSLLVWRVGSGVPRCAFVGSLENSERSGEVLAMAWCPTSCDELALVLSDKTVQVYKWVRPNLLCERRQLQRVFAAFL